MPERVEGEIVANLHSLISAGADMAKMREVEMFCYRLSNNLTEGPDAPTYDQGYDSILEEKYWNIIDTYDEIKLPILVWRCVFRLYLRSGEPTGSALVEKLLEAAVVTAQHHIVEMLLEAGANPNHLVRNTFTGILQRPVQFAVQPHRFHHTMLEILISNGADVNLTSTKDRKPALEWAAATLNLRAFSALIEAGAAIEAPEEADANTGAAKDGHPRPSILKVVVENTGDSHKQGRCWCPQSPISSRSSSSPSVSLIESPSLAPSASDGGKSNPGNEGRCRPPVNDEELAAIEILQCIVPLYKQA